MMMMHSPRSTHWLGLLGSTQKKIRPRDRLATARTPSILLARSLALSRSPSPSSSQLAWEGGPTVPLHTRANWRRYFLLTLSSRDSRQSPGEMAHLFSLFWPGFAETAQYQGSLSPLFVLVRFDLRDVSARLASKDRICPSGKGLRNHQSLQARAQLVVCSASSCSLLFCRQLSVLLPQKVGLKSMATGISFLCVKSVHTFSDPSR